MSPPPASTMSLSSQKKSRQDELESLRRRGLARLLNKHFTSTAQEMAEEREAADLALRELEKRKAEFKSKEQSSSFSPSSKDTKAEWTLLEQMYAELRRRKDDVRQKERETAELYQKYVGTSGVSAGLFGLPSPTAARTNSFRSFSFSSSSVGWASTSKLFAPMAAAADPNASTTKADILDTVNENHVHCDNDDVIRQADLLLAKMRERTGEDCSPDVPTKHRSNDLENSTSALGDFIPLTPSSQHFFTPTTGSTKPLLGDNITNINSSSSSFFPSIPNLAGEERWSTPKSTPSKPPLVPTSSSGASSSSSDVVIPSAIARTPSPTHRQSLFITSKQGDDQQQEVRQGIIANVDKNFLPDVPLVQKALDNNNNTAETHKDPKDEATNSTTAAADDQGSTTSTTMDQQSEVSGLTTDMDNHLITTTSSKKPPPKRSAAEQRLAEFLRRENDALRRLMQSFDNEQQQSDNNLDDDGMIDAATTAIDDVDEASISVGGLVSEEGRIAAQEAASQAEELAKSMAEASKWMMQDDGDVNLSLLESNSKAQKEKTKDTNGLKSDYGRWKVYHSEMHQRDYYYDSHTGITTWTKPAALFIKTGATAKKKTTRFAIDTTSIGDNNNDVVEIKDFTKQGRHRDIDDDNVSISSNKNMERNLAAIDEFRPDNSNSSSSGIKTRGLSLTSWDDSSVASGGSASVSRAKEFRIKRKKAQRKRRLQMVVAVSALGAAGVVVGYTMYPKEMDQFIISPMVDIVSRGNNSNNTEVIQLEEAARLREKKEEEKRLKKEEQQRKKLEEEEAERVRKAAYEAKKRKKAEAVRLKRLKEEEEIEREKKREEEQLRKKKEEEKERVRKLEEKKKKAKEELLRKQREREEEKKRREEQEWLEAERKKKAKEEEEEAIRQAKAAAEEKRKREKAEEARQLEVERARQLEAERKAKEEQKRKEEEAARQQQLEIQEKARQEAEKRALELAAEQKRLKEEEAEWKARKQQEEEEEKKRQAEEALAQQAKKEEEEEKRFLAMMDLNSSSRGTPSPQGPVATISTKAPRGCAVPFAYIISGACRKGPPPFDAKSLTDSMLQ